MKQSDFVGVKPLTADVVKIQHHGFLDTCSESVKDIYSYLYRAASYYIINSKPLSKFINGAKVRNEFLLSKINPWNMNKTNPLQVTRKHHIDRVQINIKRRKNMKLLKKNLLIIFAIALALQPLYVGANETEKSRYVNWQDVKEWKHYDCVFINKEYSDGVRKLRI